MARARGQDLSISVSTYRYLRSVAYSLLRWFLLSFACIPIAFSVAELFEDGSDLLFPQVLVICSVPQFVAMLQVARLLKSFQCTNCGVQFYQGSGIAPKKCDNCGISLDELDRRHEDVDVRTNSG
jgi:hypothetical protein